jgi:integrase
MNNVTKRRSSGEGTINQLPSGSWRAQVSLKGRRLSHTSKNQQSARDWIRKIQVQIEQGLTYDDERTTLNTFLEGWMATKKNELRLATYEQYSWVSRLYLQPYLGKIRLKDLSSGQVQDFYDQLATAGKGVRSIRVAHAVLHSCLEQAKNLGLVARNPTEFCRVPKQNKKDLNIWSEDQVTKFLNFVHGHRNENLYYLALATGMRRGELLGLKWQDVDWMHQKLLIKRQCFWKNGGGFVLQPPKTKLGKRSIQLGQGMIQHLRSQLYNIDLMRKISKNKWKENDLVFPSIIGTPQGADNLTHEFQALVRSSGLPQIRLHDCRHTAASIMLSHGIPPATVAEMMGHSMAILLTTYTHFLPNTQDEAARLMDEITSSTEIKFNHQG